MTMGANNLDVVMTLEDRATPKLSRFTTAIKNNQTAVSDMAMGATFLGTAMLGLGTALEKSNNELAKSMSGMLKMVGGIISFAGGAVYFIYMVSKMVEGLKQLAIWQTITSALSGPAGWAKLGVGLGVAAGVGYGVSRLASGGGAPAQPSGPTNINLNVAGSVVTERELVDVVHEGLARKGDRNAGTGLGD